MIGSFGKLNAEKYCVIAVDDNYLKQKKKKKKKSGPTVLVSYSISDFSFNENLLSVIFVTALMVFMFRV